MFRSDFEPTLQKIKDKFEKYQGLYDAGKFTFTTHDCVIYVKNHTFFNYLKKKNIFRRERMDMKQYANNLGNIYSGLSSKQKKDAVKKALSLMYNAILMYMFNQIKFVFVYYCLLLF